MGSVNKTLSILFGSLFFGLLPLAADIENRNELLFFFDKIEAKGEVDVFVKKGDKRGKISIFADSQIINSVVARVSQKTLFIDANNSFEFQRRIPFVKFNASRKFPVEIIVSVKEISEIRALEGANLTCSEFSSPQLKVFHSGTGKVFLDDINSPSIYLQQNGSGTSSLKGSRTEIFEVELEGNGNLDASDLEVDSAKVIHQGSGSIQINSMQWLDARILSSGSILLYRDPEKMVIEQKGSGRIRSLFAEVDERKLR